MTRVDSVGRLVVDPVADSSSRGRCLHLLAPSPHAGRYTIGFAQHPFKFIMRTGEQWVGADDPTRARCKGLHRVPNAEKMKRAGSG